MGTVEENTIPISYNVEKLIEVIKEKYYWALKINIKNQMRTTFFGILHNLNWSQD